MVNFHGRPFYFYGRFRKFRGAVETLVYSVDYRRLAKVKCLGRI